MNMKHLLLMSVVMGALILVAGCGGSASSASAVVPASPSSSPTPTPVTGPPASAIVFAGIQNMAGWENCTGTCTSTPTAVYALTQGVTTPSQSGAAARYQLLSGTLPFGSALWFKYLTANNNATHFIFDLQFYVDNPAAPQALEFNVTQSAGGNRYNFSTQCDLAARSWRIWEPVALKWVATSVSCDRPPANTWNHLVWEFERDPSGNVIFAAVTVNGNRSVVNIRVGHTADNTSGIDVAFQPDANLTPDLYSVWLDKVTLTFW
jgi:hypothetical protein